MIFSKMFLWFLIYSFFGWTFEVIYNIIVTGKWENRGFFYGPVVPIYGVGAVSITMIYGLMDGMNYKPEACHVFIISFVGSVILEYSTSWALEKRFHAVWWDYSNLPFNVNGRICLPASTAFGFAGVAVVDHVSPWMEHLTADIPAVAVEGISLVSMALFAADFTLTVSALTEFERLVETMDSEMNQYMENKVGAFYERAVGVGQRVGEAGQKMADMKQAATDSVSQRVGEAGQKMADMKQAATDSMSQRVGEAGQKMADMGQKVLDREKIFKERMEGAFGTIGIPRMGAIRRVRGFRTSDRRYSGLKIEAMNKALGFVKLGFYKRVMGKLKKKSGKDESAEV